LIALTVLISLNAPPRRFVILSEAKNLSFLISLNVLPHLFVIPSEARNLLFHAASR